MLVWLSVWSEVQACRPSWCHCHSLSLASVKSRLVLPFWYRLTWAVPEKGPLKTCVCVSSRKYPKIQRRQVIMNVLHPSWATTDLGSQTASSRLQCRQRQSPTTQSSVQNIYNNDNVIGRWWSADEMQTACWQLHANQQKVYKPQAFTLLLLLAVCCVHQEGYKKIQHSEWDSSSVYILGDKLKKARKKYCMTVLRAARAGDFETFYIMF